MELPSKLLEQIAFNTRPKKDEHILIVMDKSTHKEHLFPKYKVKSQTLILKDNNCTNLSQDLQNLYKLGR